METPETTTGHDTGTTMAHYFVDNAAETDGAHMIHATGCHKLPTDKRYLGNFYNVDEAQIEARKDFWQIRGCTHCSSSDASTADTVRVLKLSAPGRPDFT
jgi:hypothetical protein